MIYYDTYFLNSKDALRVSLQNNKVLAPNGQVKAPQICYYDGKKLKNAPKNCINVKQENFIKYFIQTKNRIPTNLNDDNHKLKNRLVKSTRIIHEKLELKVKKLELKVKSNKPNFKDKKLRIFVFGCRETILIKYLVQNIIDAASKLNYEVLNHKQTNSMQGCQKHHYLKALYKFNPHITININHLNNTYLNKKVFNFVWYQDPVSELLNNKRIHLRKRDFLFHITKGIGKLINKKGSISTYQPFCINTTDYKLRKNIIREEKVVFIGSSYLNDFKALKHPYKQKLFEVLLKKYLNNGVVSYKERKSLGVKYNIDSHVTMGIIINYIERDISLLYISKILTNYTIEVYGKGWEKYTELNKYYKGILKYGEDISKVYNSAKYSLSLGGYVLQQRTLESAASGCIPIVIDSRKNKGSNNNIDFEKSLLFIKRIYDYAKVIQEKNSLDLNYIVELNTYESFINKISKLIKDNS